MSEIPPYRPDPLEPGYSPAREGGPDAQHDHHVSFPDQPAQTPAATQSEPPTAPTTGVPSRSYPSYQSPGSQSPPPEAFPRAGGAPGGPNPSLQPAWASPGRQRSRLRTLVLVAVFAVALPLVAIGLVVGARHDGGSDPSPSSSRPTTVPNSPLTADPTPVPRLTPDVRSVRFEVQGTGRADIRLYRDGASERIKDVTLPYAVSVPVGDERSPYLTISATDYERTDSMKCIATAGEEVVSVNVGTRRVECTVTSSSLPTTDVEQ